MRSTIDPNATIRAQIAAKRETYLYNLPESKAQRDAAEFALKANPEFWLALLAETYPHIGPTIAALNSVTKSDYGSQCGVWLTMMNHGIKEANGEVTIRTPDRDHTLTLQVSAFSADLRDGKLRWQTHSKAEKRCDEVSKALENRVAELFASYAPKPRAR